MICERKWQNILWIYILYVGTQTDNRAFSAMLFVMMNILRNSVADGAAMSTPVKWVRRRFTAFLWVSCAGNLNYRWHRAPTNKWKRASKKEKKKEWLMVCSKNINFVWMRMETFRNVRLIAVHTSLLSLLLPAAESWRRPYATIHPIDRFLILSECMSENESSSRVPDWPYIIIYGSFMDKEHFQYLKLITIKEAVWLMIINAMK